MPKQQVAMDESVKIPAAAKAAAAKAEAIHNSVYKKPEVVEAPAEPAKPAEPVAAEPAAPAPAPAPEPAKVTPQVTDQDWESRFNAMKGRFMRSERTNKEMGERIANMEHLMTTMQQPAAPARAPASNEIPELHLSKKEIEEYGEDFIGVTRKAAREEFNPRIAQLEKALRDANNRLDQLTGTVQHTAQNAALTARQQMLKDLTDAVPNWKQINTNENFLNWLDLPETYSGVIRQELLKAAYDANDVSRVLAFFQGFLASEAASVPQETPAPAPAAQPASAKVPLETFAAPGRAKTAPTPVAAEKPIFTRADVTNFYVEVTRGAYRGRDEEKAKIEQQIHLAGREGRIV